MCFLTHISDLNGVIDGQQKLGRTADGLRIDDQSAGSGGVVLYPVMLPRAHAGVNAFAFFGRVTDSENISRLLVWNEREILPKHKAAFDGADVIHTLHD